MKSLVQVILSTVLLLTLFSGCSTQPKPAKEIKADPTLPVITINGHLTDMNAVAFEWKKIEDPRVQGVFIYRSELASKDTRLSRIATIDGRHQTHYTDQDVKPGTDYGYAFTSFSDKLTQSKPSKKQKVKTLPVLDSVSFFQSIDRMPRSAKLIWRPHTNLKVANYIIERKTTEDDDEWKRLSVIKNRLSAEYIDADLEDNAVYHYRIRVMTFDDIISAPSQTITITTKPLPETIETIIASKEQVQKITLSWEASESPDIAYYNIYRTTALDKGFEYHVKLKETKYVDKVDQDGVVYYYKVTAVDKDGLEGVQGKKAVQGATLAKPTRPIAVMVHSTKGTLKLQWKSTDKRTVSYTLIKSTKESWVNTKVQEIKNIKKEYYTDKDVVAETPYSYQIVAVDRLGMRSEPTDPVKMTMKAK